MLDVIWLLLDEQVDKSITTKNDYLSFVTLALTIPKPLVSSVT